MSLVAAPMTDKPQRSAEFCRYVTVKIDVEVLHEARHAALDAHQTIQEWLSDAANAAMSRATGRKPVKRKPPPPRPDRRKKT